MTILTGTRWTILTKLPVAFSAEKAVNFEPEPSWMLSTWPRQIEAADTRRRSILTLLAWPHLVELVLLEIGGDPDIGRDDREYLLARRDIIARFDIALGDPAVLRGRDDGPGQIEIGLVEPRLRLLDLPAQLSDLRVGLADSLRDGRFPRPAPRPA